MRYRTITAFALLTACGSSKPEVMASAEDGGSLDSAADDGTAGTGTASASEASASADGTGSASIGDTTTADVDDGAVDSPVQWDVGVIPDTPELPCSGKGKGGGGDDPEFTYLWAANSAQGTISKIDTQTVVEMGRYIVRPDSAGSPSRTSVSISGNVAVANRNGGITKVYADEADCVESNGQPGIQTSNGNAALPWGEEECIAWYTPFNYMSQRPVAWVKGELNPITCEFDNEQLWTAGLVNGQFDVLLLDGESGAVVEQTQIVGLIADTYGLYGGAVDGEGNFWSTQLGANNRLLRVDIDDLSYEIWMPPNGPHWYGMTVDSDGYVWMCSDTVARFDPMTETFMTAVVGGWTGCAAANGDDGLLWMASSSGSGVIGVNRETLAVEASWPTATSYGMSVDYDGYVWTVNGSSAIRIDPATGVTTAYNGLTGAYTYSDMTGYALTYAGGGAPSG